MDTKSLLKTLVETESPSHNKDAVNKVASIVIEEAKKLDANIQVIENIETGNHVISKWGNGKNNILVLCHLDTVFPLGTIDKMPYREADGKIFGPGTLDMKSGIVIALGAIEDAMKNGMNRSVTLLCTSDEEIGSATSRDLIEKLAKESELVLVMESALVDGSLKTWRKGVGEFWVTTKGRAAHAGGDHEKGRNAIEEMAHQILKIQKLTDYSRQTTLNVGVIHGGTVSNVVPEECTVQVDVRVMQPGEWERIESKMKKLRPVLHETLLKISGGLNRPPMPFDETMKKTFEKARSIAEKIGIELKAGGSGGGSDGNFVAPLGIPILDGMGAIGEGYHSEREYIFADSLNERINLISELLRKW